jgi:hypothetical protein
MLWHDIFKNLYCDLHIADDTTNELAGRFSSGHVAEPLGKE